MNGFLQNKSYKGSLSQFYNSNIKLRPIVSPPNDALRPCLSCCCSCMPLSKNYMAPLLKNSSLVNILQLPYDFRNLNYFKRNICILHFVLTRRVNLNYPEINESLLQNKRLKLAISKTISEQIEDIKSTEHLKIERTIIEEVNKIIVKMRASISNILIRITGWFLHKLLSRLLSSIVVDTNQLKIIKQISLEKKPLVFLPTHRSHLDYILITFILFNFNIHAPHVAAGENLLIPFFGALMRGLGGFFIRRKLDQQVGKKDLIYRATLQAYIEEVMKEGQYLEIFIEGGRTRSGKALYPKSGLLSVIVDAFNDGIIEDAYIIPVSISYDKLLDGNFTNELMGLPKKYETFFGTVRAIYKVMIGHYGSSRVNFSQPFSLKELISSFSSSTSANESQMLSITNDPITADCVTSGYKTLDRKTSDFSISTSANDIRPIVDNLAIHVIYGSVQMQTIMSTQILALLLLTKYREGVEFNALAAEFESVVSLVKSRSHDVGFSGKSEDVVAKAIQLLSHLIDCRVSKVSGIEDKKFVMPHPDVMQILELSYYSNALLVIFAAESIIVNTYFSLIRKKDGLMSTENSQLSLDEILSHSVQLSQLLKYEFILAPPCQTLEEIMRLTLEQLQHADLLIPIEHLEDEDEQFNKKIGLRIANALFYNDIDNNTNAVNYSEEKVLYTISKEGYKTIEFFQSLLSPILETYLFVACHFMLLLQKDYTEEEFIKNIHQFLLKRYNNKETKYGESLSIDTIRNALHGFENIGVIYSYKLSNIPMIALTPDYLNVSIINSLISHLMSYRGV